MTTRSFPHDHSEHDHSHGSGAPYRRTDVKGYVAIRYAPNDRLAFTAEWKPYYVTANQEKTNKASKMKSTLVVFMPLVMAM